MVIQRGYKFRFCPTLRQRRQLAMEFGCARAVYNWALALPKFNRIDVSRTVTELKKTSKPHWKKASATVLVNALYDAESAYQRWWKKLANRPRFKSRFSATQQVTYQFNKLQPKRLVSGKRLALPKLGDCRIIWSQSVDGLPESVTVTRHSTGEYYVTLNSVKVNIEPLPWINSVVGIDLGIKDLVVESNGHKVKNPGYTKRTARRLAHASRALSRKVGARKGQAKSHNFLSQKRRAARIHRKRSNQRQAHLHGITARLVSGNAAIAIEELSVRGMMSNRRLASAVGDCGWSELRRQLTYKCQWAGRQLSVVDRWDRTTGVCPHSGWVGPRLALSVRKWICESCGQCHDRDVAAAQVIAIRGLGLPWGSREVMGVEGQINYTPQNIVGQWGSGEAPTAQQAA